ncbi:NB-ARC domain-containing protein [Promicromonospora sp. NPDC060271]|uniref:tetratricopeptide repeat protein n=1 Tax=Promicromonospora sp. NPDC060271 TaxID=3347089 RepID=UPI0036602538
MLERTEMARDESDTAYFFDLLYTGELVLKLIVTELLAGVLDDRDGHGYAAEYRLIRADGIGEWSEVLDELLTGPGSHHLTSVSRESQRALSMTFGPGADAWQRQAAERLNYACRCLDETQLDLSQKKVSLRQWVRQFVWLRNRTRGHGAPRGESLSAICPPLHESILAVISNVPALQRDWAYLKRNLSGKHRVSAFGGSRQPFEHLVRESHPALTDGVYVNLDGFRKVKLIYTDPDLADFFLPNGNFRKSQFQVISYISDETRSETAAQWSLPPGSQLQSETRAAPNLAVIGEVFTNMPPSRPDYVHRPALEVELSTVLRDSRNPVVTLKGRGGIGKTSLALKVLHEVAEGDDFFAIVWFSARDIDLLPEGPKVVRPDVLTTADVARDFVVLFEPDVTLKERELQQRLTDCLSGKSEDGPFLFVFDNFETIREQSELYTYLNNSIRLPNKVLITTRTRDFKADYPIEVKGMARTEFSDLVDDVAERVEIATIIDPPYKQQLYDESDGHPYITKIILGEVAREQRKVSLKHVVAAHDAVLDALFDRSFASLSPAAQRVFLTLCNWRSYVPRIGLEAVLLRPGNERMEVLDALLELHRSSLVEEIIDPESGTDFLSVPLAASVFGKRKLVTSPFKIAIEADLQLVRAFGPITATEASLGLEPRLDRLTKAIAVRLGEGDNSQELAVLEYIASHYPPAWLHLAELQQEMGNSDGSRVSVSKYLESKPTDESAWRQLITLYKRASDPLGEMHARLQLAELTRPDYKELSTAASRLNGMLSRREIEVDADERRLMVRKLRQLLEERVVEADANDLSGLGWLCMHDKDAESALKWAQAGLAKEPDNEHCLKLLRRVAARDGASD